jgi:hypothetical protein
MQAVVDRLAATLGQSVLIEDVDQHPVWWSTVGPVDRTRMRTILNRSVDPAAASVVKQFHLADTDRPVRTPAIPDADMWARWCMPIRNNKQLLGLIWVLDPDEKIDETGLQAIVACADAAAASLVQLREEATDRLRRRDELVERLLAGPDRATAEHLAWLEGLPADVRVQVRHPAQPGEWPLPDGMSVYVVDEDVISAPSGKPLPLVDLAEAVRRARAARRAIAAGATVESGSWDDLGPWRLIVDAPESLSPKDIHPGVEQLSQSNRKDLRDTARVVLDQGCDIAASAAVLHLHRTTLYYRLDRVLELTGVDLRAHANRTSLQLALWLAAYRDAEL